jgi:hypothetical protein
VQTRRRSKWEEEKRDASEHARGVDDLSNVKTTSTDLQHTTAALTAECNILECFVLRQCGAVAACESRLLRAAVNGSLQGGALLGSMTSY